MRFESVSRLLLLCLLLGCPKNLVKFLTHVSADEVGHVTSLKGSPTTASHSHQPSVTSRTPVTLNVKKKKTTDKFDYINENGIGTYTAKDDFGFNKVKGGGELIWEAPDPYHYATKVVSDGLSCCASIKNVTAYLVNDAVIKLTKENKKWKAEVLNPPKEVEENPKPNEENGGGQSIVETGKPKNENPGSKPEEEDGTGRKDPEQSTESQPLFHNSASQQGRNAGGPTSPTGGALSGTSHGPKPKELEGVSNEKRTVPDGRSQQANQAARSGGSPGSQPESGYSSRGSGGSQERSGSSTPEPPKVTFIDVDLIKKHSTNQVEYKKENDVETYTAKEGFAIKKYSEGTDVKWTSDGTQYYREVKKYKDQDGTFKYEEIEYNPNNSTDLPKGVKLITQDPSDESKAVENDATQFSIKNNNGMLECSFKMEAKCVKLMIDDNEVWKHGDENIQEYPKAIKIHKTERALVEFASNIIFYTKTSDGKWDTNVYSTSSSSGSGNDAQGGVSGRPINPGRLAAMAEGKND